MVLSDTDLLFRLYESSDGGGGGGRVGVGAENRGICTRVASWNMTNWHDIF